MAHADRALLQAVGPARAAIRLAQARAPAIAPVIDAMAVAYAADSRARWRRARSKSSGWRAKA
jgi:hypothetical protein